MAGDEIGTLGRLKACRAIIDELIAAHRGRIFNTAGDSVVADFASAVDAVECAVAVQKAIAVENEHRPAAEQMRLRIGVHLGDVIVEGANLFGDGVNIAARLQALADPGGICISGAVRDQIGQRLNIPVTTLGEQRVKNIADPVRAFRVGGTSDQGMTRGALGVARALVHFRGRIPAAILLMLVALGGAAWWFWPGPDTELHSPRSEPATAPAVPAPRLSIVVMPFANLSNDPQQEYFA